jgi:hypothetical protein
MPSSYSLTSDSLVLSQFISYPACPLSIHASSVSFSLFSVQIPLSEQRLLQ